MSLLIRKFQAFLIRSPSTLSFTPLLPDFTLAGLIGLRGNSLLAVNFFIGADGTLKFVEGWDLANKVASCSGLKFSKLDESFGRLFGSIL